MNAYLLNRILLISFSFVFCYINLSCTKQDKQVSNENKKLDFKNRIIRIGVANITLGPSYFSGIATAIESEYKPYSNIKIFKSNADGDGKKFIADVNDLLKKNIDGLIISAGWIEYAKEIFEACESENVPVVLVDRKLKGGTYTSWIGPDNYFIGQQIGTFIQQRLPKGNLVIIRGGPEDNSIGYNRTNGVVSNLDTNKIKVFKSKTFGGWSEEGGYKIMKIFLDEVEGIDAVFCENDSMCLGAQKALIESGKNDIFLTGVDGAREALKKIKEGTKYVATGLNDAYTVGKAAANRLMAILAHATPPKETVLESPIITKENINTYYKD